MQKRQKPSNEANLKKYRIAMLELLRMKQPRASLTGPALNPRPLSLSPEARNLWVAFADECERELAAGQQLEHVRAFANNIAEQALHLAAVVELVDNPDAADTSSATSPRPPPHA